MAPVRNWNPSEFSWTCPTGESGTYYVVLAPYNSSGSHTCDGDGTDIFTMYYYMAEPDEPPANDDCVNAEVVGEVTGLAWNTSAATTSGVGTNSINQDIFYEFTAPGDGTIDVDLCGSSFDTKVAVWDGCAGTELDYDDDGCPSKTTRSLIEGLDVTDGESYIIQIGGYGSNSGEGELTIIFTEAPVTGTLSGVVTDFSTGLPIDGAMIDITPVIPSKEVTYTNELGEYEIELEPGDYDVVATAAGYYPSEPLDGFFVTITAGVITIQDFYLIPLPPLTIPFFEGFDDGSFETNSWTPEGNWGIATTGGYGNPVPAARFNWTPTFNKLFKPAPKP